MKKFFTIAVALLLTTGAVALDNVPESGTSFQALVGFNVTNLKGFQTDMNAKAGLNIGAKLEIMLPNAYGTYINAGIDWTQKGARRTDLNTQQYAKMVKKVNSHYLELPIHVGYRYNISDVLGVYGEVGPYFAFGVTGKYKRINADDGVTDEGSEMLFGKHVGRVLPYDAIENGRVFQRFDCGFGFRVGVEYDNKYSFNIGYDGGFTDMYTGDYRRQYEQRHDYSPLPKLKNHNWTMTVGYRF